MWAGKCWDELGRGEGHCEDASSSLADKVETAAKKDYSSANQKPSLSHP